MESESTTNTKALIVRVSINKLGQTEKDDDLTAEIHRLHGMKDEAGSYTKALYPPGSFKEIQQIEGKVRRFHTSEQGKRLILTSLGWVCPGPHVEFYHEKVKELEGEFYPAVERVRARWSDILGECRRIQSGKFKASDYPPQERVMEHFKWRLTMSPLPRIDSIGELDFLCAERIEEVRAQVQGDVARAAHDGAQQAMARVLELVNRISTSLAKPDPVVHDRLIENLTEMLDLAPSLNLAADPAVSHLIAQCRAKLLVAPEALRASTIQRRSVAMAAKTILSGFGQVGGRKLAA